MLYKTIENNFKNLKVSKIQLAKTENWILFNYLKYHAEWL